MNSTEGLSLVPQEWHRHIEPLLPLGERMAAMMSDPDDPQLRQELYQMIFMGIASGYVNLFGGSREQPAFRPIWNPVFNWWAPNPDASYYLAPLAADGVYKISGFRGTSRLVDFSVASGPFLPDGYGPLEPVFANYDIDTLQINQDGSFEVVLSGERPVGYQGNWWALDARATYVLVRQVAYDWINEVDGRFAIDRLDRPALRPRSSADELAAQLTHISVWAEHWTSFALRWPKKLRDADTINKATVFGLDSIGGLSTQKYVDGAFEINLDEALIYETELPTRARYWNLQLNTMLWSAIDWGNRQSVLNGHTARIDSDGRFRAVISAVDPGVPNWLDTAGYTKGTFFGRWTECNSAPAPTLKRVKVADVRRHLPVDTPQVTSEQRDADIRRLRKGSQLRHHW